ncbi:MAG: hypothetical protein Kow0026_08570 [Oricola sp.]
MKPMYQDIPLSKLEIDSCNVRAGTDYDRDGLATLAATIVEQGLKQSLLVRPGKGAKFLVTAGGRRLAAMQMALGYEQLSADFPVPCLVREMTDAEAREASLLENIEREQMSPVQQFKAWRALKDGGVSNSDIAARFGVTEKMVAQRLALADLHPKVLGLLEAEEITLGAAAAFTLGSKQQQAAYLKNVQEWQLREHQVRAAMTNSKLPASSWLAKEFIGAEAYEKAGGKVESDLFGDEAYWISEQIVNRLTEEKLARFEDEKKAEGWAFVRAKSNYQNFWNLDRFHPSGGGKFKPEYMATSGIVIDLDNGHLYEGVQDPSIVKPWSADKKDAVGDAPVKDPLAISAALSQRLSETRNAAVAEVLANDPAKALRVMIAMLDAARACSRHPSHFSALEEWKREPGASPSRRPFREFLAVALALSDKDAMKRVAEIAASNVDVTDKHCMTYSVTGYPDDCAQALVDALDPDPAPHFDAEDYSKSVSKPFLIAAITDIRNGKDCGELEKVKKVHLAEQLRIEVSGKYRPEGKDWLPPQLRTASYSGPAYEPKKARKSSGKKAA